MKKLTVSLLVVSFSLLCKSQQLKFVPNLSPAVKKEKPDKNIQAILSPDGSVNIVR